MSGSDFTTLVDRPTNDSHSIRFRSKPTKPSLLAAPTEIRQKILLNLFNIARIDHKGDISWVPPELEDICRLLKEDIEVLERLWSLLPSSG
ncbi:uncharacterized protein BDZ99DRAFT_513997 [Mytilinidion resinicola]|uniref:Uncharacterized protein n=1 Tax=Mytilinidion resinicola TaxID=574789 RepID=A0A6A6ZAB3_9PEZI|nr:uncharacterized protein BDZ99DRAFT_513997 [Mytilinidion resinicola]KAF2817778.1 hypothetical protein BDZ99DRAFT_513997 [Mytilinidion resinicola]